jgi:hypothetical protein
MRLIIRICKSALAAPQSVVMAPAVKQRLGEPTIQFCRIRLIGFISSEEEQAKIEVARRQSGREQGDVDLQ